ncbi:hypothetical protein [Streptomyces sp. NPDC001492]
MVIDLRAGVAAAPVQPHTGTEAVTRTVELADAFRARGLPMVLVRVSSPNWPVTPATSPTPSATGVPSTAPVSTSSRAPRPTGPGAAGHDARLIRPAEMISRRPRSGTERPAEIASGHPYSHFRRATRGGSEARCRSRSASSSRSTTRGPTSRTASPRC